MEKKTSVETAQEPVTKPAPKDGAAKVQVLKKAVAAPKANDVYKSPEYMAFEKKIDGVREGNIKTVQDILKKIGDAEVESFKKITALPEHSDKSEIQAIKDEFKAFASGLKPQLEEATKAYKEAKVNVGAAYEEEISFVLSKDAEYEIFNDPHYIEWEREVTCLRADGVNLIVSVKEEIATIKKNVMIDVLTKDKIITNDKIALEKAKAIAHAYSKLIKSIEEEAGAYVKAVRKLQYAKVSSIEKPIMAKAQEDYKAAKLSVKEKHASEIAALEAKQREDLAKETERVKQSKVKWQEECAALEAEGKKTLPFVDEYAIKQMKAIQKGDRQSEINSYKSSKFDEQTRFQTIYGGAKDRRFAVINNGHTAIKNLNNGSAGFVEDRYFGAMDYGYKFNLGQFLMRNALYIIILLFFVYCCIYSPIAGFGNLLTLQSILDILENSSTRMFYALGVAGLILLAGTDLSIGRMVGLGAVITSVLLHDGKNIISFLGGDPWNFSAMPWVVRIVLAFVLSIFFCTLFSAIAGFFTAKFKMHPFISTLGTQLIIYGLLYYATSGVSSGGVSDEVRTLVAGRWTVGALTIPKLLIPMILIIIVMWFIWNKTKFGKEMYAVGGNAEAASVSGINVFWVTLGVFIIAGVLYGMGSFFEAFKSNSSAGTGYGFELDAIASCVVGGISFSGGIGKIKGAVIGVFIFTALTYCLSWIGVDTNLGFVIKGIIIIAAVALDCAKYLKKK